MIQMLITIRDILSTPALLVGVVLLSEGSSFLQTGALKDFGVLFNYDFHIQGVVPNMEAVSSMGIAKYATDVSLIMFFGMIANMVMARFGPFHYIFLTGHHTLYMACLLAIVLHVCQMIGFLMSFLGGVVVMACLLKFNSMKGEQLLPVIVPGVVAHFFCGGTAGVFANSEGGVKGCLIGSFVHGVLITFLSLAVIPVLGTLDMSGTTFSDADFCAVGIVLGNIANHVAKDGMLVLAFTVFILPIFYQFSKKFK